MVSSLSACLRDEPFNQGEGDPQTGTQTDPQDDPQVEVKEYTLGEEYSELGPDGLDGLSAICLNETGDGLLVAEDNGHVLEFGLDGTLKATRSFAEPNDARDWEGITMAADGTIYLSEERTREIYKLSSDHKSVTLVSGGPKEGKKENQGFEGIAAGNGVLYICNQSAPFRVYTYTIATGKWATAFDVSGAESLSDIYYDSEDGTLWITDANTHLLTQLSKTGKVLHEYKIDFVDKPEGFCKDTVRKKFWFVCDGTAKIYSVSYN
ncbi:MAG: SdiA-regulated domain-containing protein [Bacteroidales bacterium]|nr:SdiA-regulated domain-containing protein [Bacteroidales bacterium]